MMWCGQRRGEKKSSEFPGPEADVAKVAVSGLA
jgi:hypothetical protein